MTSFLVNNTSFLPEASSQGCFPSCSPGPACPSLGARLPPPQRCDPFLSCGAAGAAEPSHPQQLGGIITGSWCLGLCYPHLEDLPPGRYTKALSCGSVPAPEQLNPGLSNRLPHVLGEPGEQGEPGILRLGLSKLLLQPRARAGICAQPGHGTTCHRESKTRNRAGFGFQKSLQLSQAGLESTDTGKKGNQRGSAASHQELPAHGLVWLPPARCECLEGHKCRFN